MGNDLSEDYASEEEKSAAALELEDKRDHIEHKNSLFTYLKVGLGILYFFAGAVVCLSLIPGKAVPATNTVIVVTLIMVPTILTLALMRFLYGNHQQITEKNLPSLTLNVGKELVGLTKEILKKD